MTSPHITVDQVNALTSRLKSSTILTSSSTGYAEALSRWSDGAVKQAGIVVLPSTAEDVSQSVLFAQGHNLDLAIRGGGHSVAGTSSSDGGLVIDLSRMRKVIIDPEKKTIMAQGGALWVDVDTAAGKYGLATVGGTVNHTGIGGLTLGGGYGWLSPKYGLVVDNLLSATLVLADGRIVTASATQNEDLFWAIRGAGHNFGVAVEFVYRAHDQPNEIFAGVLAFTPDKVGSVIDVLNSTIENPDTNSGVLCALARPPGAPVPMVNTVIYYNGTEAEAKQRFKDLYALEPVADMTKMMPYSELNGIQNQMASHGGRKTFKGLFFAVPLNGVFVQNILQIFTKKILSDPELGASGIIIEFLDVRKVGEVELTSTAFANRGSTLNGVVILRWNDPSKDAEYRAFGRELQMMWKKEHEQSLAEKNLEMTDVPQYVNYAEPGDAVVPKIFGVNTERLQKIKAKYDPQNVFCKMNPIAPVA